MVLCYCVKNQLPFQSHVNTEPNQKYALPQKHSTLKELLEHLDLDEDCPASEYYTPSEFNKLDLKNSNLFILLNPILVGGGGKNYPSPREKLKK